jgi:hypothetical protein
MDRFLVNVRQINVCEGVQESIQRQVVTVAGPQNAQRPFLLRRSRRVEEQVCDMLAMGSETIPAVTRRGIS